MNRTRTLHSPSAHSLPLLVICILMLASCNDQSKTSSNLARNGSSTAARTASPAPAEPAPYFGEDWADQNRNSSLQGNNASPTATPSSRPGKPAAPVPPAPVSAPADSNAVWSLVVGTYSGAGHQDAAHQMIANMRLIAPQVTGLRVHTTPKGSMVVYGRYSGRDDPSAAADQERLKSVMYQNRPVFNRVLLTRLDLRLTQGQLHPHDLLSARRAHPKVDPLYTLDVAIWMSNDDPKARDRITYDEVKRKAEAYCAELRARKEQAYFYHDDVNQWSTVTVELFDRRAIDQKSGLFSPAVTNVMKRFPARLVNGEPLIELKDPRDPRKGGSPQQPKLVLVPTM